MIFNSGAWRDTNVDPRFNVYSKDFEMYHDYGNVSQDDLLNQFRTENWSQLDERQKVSVIQELEYRNAEQQGRTPTQVIALKGDKLYGSYSNYDDGIPVKIKGRTSDVDYTKDGGTIRINVNDFSSYDTLDTYIHESNHAYQGYCIANGENIYDEDVRILMQAESARDENGNLYNYETRDVLYDMQCNEIDSNNVAAEYLLGQRERFEDDPVYHKYMEDRQDHFQKVNAWLATYRDQRFTMQMNQTYNAYVRGDITEAEYQQVNQSICNSQHYDAAECKSFQTQAHITAFNRGYEASSYSAQSTAAAYESPQHETAAEPVRSNDNDYSM